MEDDNYAGKSWGFYTPEILLPNSELGYLITCINFDKGLTGNYRLELMSETPLESPLTTFEDHFYFKHNALFEGVWSKQNRTVGGCS